MGSVVIFFGSVVGSVVSFSVVGFVFSVVSVVGSVVSLVACVVGVSVVFWSAAQCSAVNKTQHVYTYEPRHKKTCLPVHDP